MQTAAPIPVDRPTEVGPPIRSWRTPLSYLLVALVLGGLVAAVAVFGGFERRTDLLRPAPVGSMITTGPYVFTFTGATAQQRTSFSGERMWRVTAVGTARTTGDVSISPDISDTGVFVSKDDAGGEIQNPSGQLVGEGRMYGAGSRFTPGLPPIAYRVEFDYSDRYQPGATIRFAVFDLEWRDPSLLGTDDPTWKNRNTATVLELPITLLPPDED